MMFSKLKIIFKPSNWILFIFIALCIKLIFLFSTIKICFSDTPNNLYLLHGDQTQFVAYCENFYNTGVYYEKKDNRMDYTGRVPGMCVLYYPLRLFFNQHITITLFVFIQTLISAIATYLFALIAKKIYKSDISFYFIFILFSLSTFCARYNNFLFTESLAVSTLIFSSYFFISFTDDNKLINIFLSSIFLTWCVFLRAFIAPFILLISLFLFIRFLKNVKLEYKPFLVFIIPVILIFGSWTIRNYQVAERFVPLDTSLDGLKADIVTESRFRFIQTFGFGWDWWDPNSENTWFSSDSYLSKDKVIRPDDSIFPKYVFSDRLTIDTLKLARTYYWLSLDTSIYKATRDYYSLQSSVILENFIKSFKDRDPFRYYIGCRLKIMFKFLNQSMTTVLRSIKYPFNVLIVYADSIINHFVIGFGLISIIIILLSGYFKDIKYLWISSIPVFIITFFTIIMRDDDRKELTLAYPFLLICTFKGIDIIKKIRYNYVLFFLLGIILIILGLLSIKSNIVW